MVSQEHTHLNILLAAEKLGNRCAPSSRWVPQHTAGHLRRSPMPESSPQEKLHNEMRFSAGASFKPTYAYQNTRLYPICISMQTTTIAVSKKAIVLKQLGGYLCLQTQLWADLFPTFFKKILFKVIKECLILCQCFSKGLMLYTSCRQLRARWAKLMIRNKFKFSRSTPE